MKKECAAAVVISSKGSPIWFMMISFFVSVISVILCIVSFRCSHLENINNDKGSRKLMWALCYWFQSQKQPSRDVFRKRCSENLQQIYRTTPILKCDFNKVAKQVVNLLVILLMYIVTFFFLVWHNVALHLKVMYWFRYFCQK